MAPVSFGLRAAAFMGQDRGSFARGQRGIRFASKRVIGLRSNV